MGNTTGKQDSRVWREWLSYLNNPDIKRECNLRMLRDIDYNGKIHEGNRAKHTILEFTKTFHCWWF